MRGLMAVGTEFCLLGPLVVRCGGAVVRVQPGKQRVVLAALLLDAGRVVPVDAIAEALWGTAPPPSARVTVRNYVKRLRHALGDVGQARISTRPGGYLISVEAGELDVTRFEALLAAAQAAARDGSWDRAAGQARAALALWRGEPLEDVESGVLATRETPRLAEMRLQALELRIDADLHLGHQSEVIAELRQLISTQPLREQFHGQLMLALYRGGRQAEALAAYQHVRRLLVEELGIEPATGLRELHRQVLTADPALTADPVPAAGESVTAAGPAAEPAQLPPDTADFTGREEQVRLVCDLLSAQPSEGRSGAVVISAVAGMGGIGKTALAVHVAHRLRDRFPDGQLYASLQGATRPLRPAEVLARFLRDLGVPDTAIPAAEAERAARYRTLLARRQILIVLDDARDAAQVRPLLPGSASCAVIVTSRTTLPGLAGTTLLDLAVLPPDEARALFTAITGPARTTAEPDATASVLASCAGLPLALRIAASRLASRPGWSIAHLSARLADQKIRLTELTAGDLAVRTTFAVSYDALAHDEESPEPARVFRLLGLAETADLSLPAITALTGQNTDDTARALETLTDTHLLQALAPDRYRLHDLLRTYAAELTEHTDTPADRNTAITRMLRWYGEQAIVAARVLRPGRWFPAAVLPQRDAAPAAMTEAAQALDWYESELPGLLAAVRLAADLGMDDIAAQITFGTWEFFNLTPYRQDWLAMSQIGVDSARRLGDDTVLSTLLTCLGQVLGLLDRFAESRRCLSEALDIRRRAGDRSGEGAVLNALAVALCTQELFEDALEHSRSGLAIHIALGEQRQAGFVLNNMGYGLLKLKRHGEALDCLGQALAVFGEIGDRYGQGLAEGTLGDTHLDLGRFDDAVEHYRLALAAYQDATREHPDQADVLCGLGSALNALRRTGEARKAWLSAIPILDRLGDPRAGELRDRLSDLGGIQAQSATLPTG